MTQPTASDVVGYERLRAVATAALAGRVGRTATCARGCAACCSQMVLVTLADALLIARYLIKTLPADRLAAVAVRLERDGAAQRGHDALSWFALDRPCTFLGVQGECSVYEARPVNCRRYYVTSPASRCASGYLVPIMRGTRSGSLPQFVDWTPEFGAVDVASQESVRSLLCAAGIATDLPPAPLPLAVSAALYTIGTGRPDALRSWADGV